jgi:Ca2+-binding EF-hand superfamily protein
MMKSATKHILCFMIIAFVCFSASESSALHDLFKSLDKNRDGRIDRNEFSEDMKKEAFSKLDKDKNGEISYEEWKRLYGLEEPDRHGEMFKRMDKDKNKGITFFEFSDYADRYSNIDEAFMGLDKNGNNSIEPDEMTMRPLFKWITVRF